MALIRSVFQDELDGVSQSLVDLSNMVAESIAKATKSILTSDLKLAEDVIASDDAIDDFQHDLDARIIDIIAHVRIKNNRCPLTLWLLHRSGSLLTRWDVAPSVSLIYKLREVTQRNLPNGFFHDVLKPQCGINVCYSGIADGIFGSDDGDFGRFSADGLDGSQLYPPAQSTASVVFPDCGDALLEHVRLARALKHFRKSDKLTA